MNIMDEEKNKEIIQKLMEKNKELKERIGLKPTIRGRIWFTLTCLRPVTKLEFARTAQAIVQNRRLTNKMVIQMNSLTIKMSEIIGYLQGKRDSNLSKDMNNNLVKKLKERKKDDVMYR
ncbi:unnamed protein product [marine sediment metagenome]|uniref:Uncharacterized protein n=1 Tax=marine sediment metagenome TaxID=412755 RepID=X1CC13_9ZZZZ